MNFFQWLNSTLNTLAPPPLPGPFEAYLQAKEFERATQIYRNQSDLQKELAILKRTAQQDNHNQ